MNVMRAPVAARIAALAVATIAVVGVALDVSDPPETHTIHASYAFDLRDPELVAGSSDALAIVTVTSDGVASKDETGMPRTDFDVQLDRALKGTLPAAFSVRQIGGRDGEDTYVLDGQPLLQRGTTYVVALTGSQAPYVLLAGPISAKPLASERAVQRAVVDAWRAAIANQRLPG